MQECFLSPKGFISWIFKQNAPLDKSAWNFACYRFCPGMTLQKHLEYSNKYMVSLNSVDRMYVLYTHSKKQEVINFLEDGECPQGQYFVTSVLFIHQNSHWMLATPSTAVKVYQKTVWLDRRVVNTVRIQTRS